MGVYFHLFCKLLHTILKTTVSEGTVAEENAGTSTMLYTFEGIMGLQQNLKEALLNTNTMQYEWLVHWEK